MARARMEPAIVQAIQDAADVFDVDSKATLSMQDLFTLAAVKALNNKATVGRIQFAYTLGQGRGLTYSQVGLITTRLKDAGFLTAEKRKDEEAIGRGSGRAIDIYSLTQNGSKFLGLATEMLKFMSDQKPVVAEKKKPQARKKPKADKVLPSCVTYETRAHLAAETLLATSIRSQSCLRA